MKSRFLPLAFALLSLLAPPAPHANAASDTTPPESIAAPDTARGRWEIREARPGGARRRFAVWLPPGFDPGRKWPAIVFLHGSGECGDDPMRPTKLGLGPALEADPKRWPFVVVFPQKPREEEEWEEQEDLVLDETDVATREFAIDPMRTALGGMSQGGHGAWTIGARHPERWSCLVPICGYGRARTVAPRVARTPVWAFHGLRDDIVDPNEAKSVVAAIREKRTALGLDPDGAKLTLYEDANHNSWDPACAEPRLPAWILAQKRTK